MTIHFICRGNTFRSRLAETYLNSKQLPNVKAISSGTEAAVNDCGPVTWYAQRLIQDGNLVAFEKPTWDQTTKNLLDEGDLTIFMEEKQYQFCKDNFGFNSKNYQIWGIHDVAEENTNWGKLNQLEKIEVTEKIFEKIKQKIDELVEKIK